MRRLSRRQLALISLVVVLGLALGAWLGLRAVAQPSSQGKLLVLLTVDSPLPAGASPYAARVDGLRLLPSGSGASWVSVAVPPTTVELPGSATAPATDDLALVTVPVGSYRRAQLRLSQAAPGNSLSASRSVLLKVSRSALTPLLFTVSLGSGSNPARPSLGEAFAGNVEVNFGLQVASGRVLKVPSLPLVSQFGAPISMAQFRGKVVVLASFLSECQETCPLVAAALLQLQQMVDREGLQSKVQIVEVTQDPADDSPAILRKYQSYFSLSWPLLTGTVANVGRFWADLKVPPVVRAAWSGPEPIDPLTGEPEPYNLEHASVVDILNPEGYVVSEMQDQPTLSVSSIPKVIYRYLDQQGRQEQRQGGSWTPQSLLTAMTPLLQQEGVYTSLPASNGVATVGQPAPSFSLTSTAGSTVRLQQELGHPLLIDFWATWCTNCRADMKLVAATAARYRAQGLRVLLVDYEESASRVTKFLRAEGISLPSLLDSQGSVAASYGVPGLPVAVFVNPKGKITAIQVGQLEAAQASQDLSGILPR